MHSFYEIQHTKYGSRSFKHNEPTSIVSFRAFTHPCRNGGSNGSHTKTSHNSGYDQLCKLESGSLQDYADEYNDAGAHSSPLPSEAVTDFETCQRSDRRADLIECDGGALPSSINENQLLSHSCPAECFFGGITHRVEFLAANALVDVLICGNVAMKEGRVSRAFITA